MSIRCETTAQQCNSCFGIPPVLNIFTDFSFKISSSHNVPDFKFILIALLGLK